MQADSTLKTEAATAAAGKTAKRTDTAFAQGPSPWANSPACGNSATK